MNFGKRLRELRISMNLKQKQLGDILNVSKATISKYELNHLQPNLETLIIISQYFKVSIDYLLDNNLNDSNAKEDKKEEDKFDKLIENVDIYLMNDKISEETKDYMVKKIQDSYWKSKELDKNNNK